jgi:hypothetical protein
MMLDELRKQELWVIVWPDGDVDTTTDPFVFLSEKEAQEEFGRYYPEDCYVTRLGRIAAEPARIAEAEGATS